MVLASLRKTKIVQSGLSSLCSGALNCTARLDDKRRSLDTPSVWFTASLGLVLRPCAAGLVKRNFALRGEKRLYLIGGLKEPVAVPKKMLR